MSRYFWFVSIFRGKIKTSTVERKIFSYLCSWFLRVLEMDELVYAEKMAVTNYIGQSLFIEKKRISHQTKDKK